MCAGAAVWANIDTIVFGALIKNTFELHRSRINLGVKEVVNKSNHKIKIIEGVLKEECLKLYGH